MPYMMPNSSVNPAQPWNPYTNAVRSTIGQLPQNIQRLTMNRPNLPVSHAFQQANVRAASQAGWGTSPTTGQPMRVPQWNQQASGMPYDRYMTSMYRPSRPFNAATQMPGYNQTITQ